jgi:ubiquinone/menaquinone biosynthesis C-methylase UbiE
MKRPSRRGGRTVSRRSSHVRTNLRLWERQSDAYDRRCRSVLGGRRSEAWGFWRVPEARLRLLGPVRHRDVLELGCGAARWSESLSRRGARVVGIDLSRSQLTKARHGAGARAGRVGLVRGNAERLPFRDRSFDLVFSDWGAMTFADPRQTVPEVARILRPGGRLVFVTSSPLRAIVQDRRSDRMGSRLRYDYFGMHRIDYPREVNFVPGYGEWFALFQAAGLEVLGLSETRPSPRDRSGYLSEAEERWARRWPLEVIWTAGRPHPPSAGRSPRRRRRSSPTRTRP